MSDGTAGDTPQVDAVVGVQIARMGWLVTPSEVSRRAHDNELLICADADANHLAVEALTQAKARVESLRDDIHERFVE